MTTQSPATAREKALKLRKRARKKKPKFVRQESWKYVRLKENWRRPRGLDNKVRLMYKGWPPRASAGYKGPKWARGLHPSGFQEVLVYNVSGLDKIDSGVQAARIAHAVGKRNRLKILTEARKKEIVILGQKQAKETEKAEVGTEEAVNEEKQESEEKVIEQDRSAEKT